MTEASGPSRSFDEKEIATILRRASELHLGETGETAPGLTADELRRVAREAGLDPSAVTAAIAELEHAPSESLLSLTLDRLVPGTLDDARWEAMLAEIRATFRDAGEVVRRGEVREWSRSTSASRTGRTYVTATPTDGTTRVQLAWDEPVLAVPPYVFAGTLSLILLPVVFESLGMLSLAGLALYLSLVATLLAAARWIVGRGAKAQKQKVRTLMARLEQTLAPPPRDAAVRDVLREPAPPAGGELGWMLDTPAAEAPPAEAPRPERLRE